MRSRLAKLLELFTVLLVACSQVFGVARGYACLCAGDLRPTATLECIESACHAGLPHADGCVDEPPAAPAPEECPSDAGDCHGHDEGEGAPVEQAPPTEDPAAPERDGSTPPSHSHKHTHQEMREDLEARTVSAAEVVSTAPGASVAELPAYPDPFDPLVGLVANAAPSAGPPPRPPDDPALLAAPSTACLVARGVVFLI